MGNPNPSPETRFGGKRGNKPNGGKTSKQKEAEYRAAEKAAIISEKLVSTIMEKLEEDGHDPLELIDNPVLKLLKDVQDRAHGTPAQSVDHTTNGKDMTDPFSSLLSEIGKEGRRVIDRGEESGD